MPLRKFQAALVLLLCLLAPFTIAAQTVAYISGTVKADGEPAPGAFVQVKGTNVRTITDDKGSFKLAAPQGGRLTLLVTSVGFSSISKEIEVKPGKDVFLTLELVANASDIDEVEVTGKSGTRKLKESGFAVNAIDTKQYANSTMDIGQVLNRSTGVKMREQGGVGSDFQFAINGLSGSGVKFFIDGVPLELMGSTMNLNNIPVNLAERVEVYKGVAPVALGADALGGSVNIVTNQHLYNYLDISHGYGSFNTHQSAVSGQYAHKATGLVAKVSAFFNYSDNNYKMKGVEIWDAAKNEYVEKSFDRFHDKYKSLMGQVELGIVNKKWADALYIGASVTQLDKDVQTGITQNIVYGAVTKEGDASNFSLRYKKNGLLNERLDLTYYASYSKDNYILTDTVLRKYSWDGSYVTGNPETGSFRVTHVNRPRIFSRLGANYKIVDHHTLSLNYTFDQVENHTYNSLTSSADETPGKLGKHLAGLGYQQELLDGKLVNTFMGKYYGISMRKRQWDYNQNKLVAKTNFESYYGYGIASVYKITRNAGIKASYEHTYRLQDVNEVFGDGYQVLNNLELKPESSDNINLGGYYGFRRNRSDFFAEAAGFYRSAKGFIYANAADNNQLQYQNLSNVLVTGGEAEVRYTWNKLISATLNGTYQYAVDNTKTIRNAGGAASATYRNKIPNQPWLFGNADIGIGKDNWLGKSSRVQFNWSMLYTHEYYRSWEGFATANSLVTIPSQFIHNLMLAYSFKDNRYNISLEGRNITDRLAYDNFRLQKPGRAFFIKARVFLKK